MADLAFCLGRDCKAVALEHNVFMKYGAINVLLWVPIASELFEHALRSSFGDLSSWFFGFRQAVYLLDKLGIATLPNC